MPKPADINDLVAIAESIIKAQGNIFIRELLRSKKKTDPTIAIGVTKEEILGNLIAAIREGKLTRDDLDTWINEVEGWGKQHAYLYNINPKSFDDALWSSVEAVQKTVKAAAFDKMWKGAGDAAFPGTLQLAGIDYDGGRFECVWRRGVVGLQRDKTKDLLDQEIEGDMYEFHAYRKTPVRSVMRFELYPKRREASLFIQMPLGPDHAQAKADAFSTLGKIFDTGSLAPVNISKAIKTLDQAELDTKGEKQSRVLAQNTKFASQGATVEFAADPTIQAWKNIAAVRQVRQALRADQFEGDSAKFIVNLQAKGGMKREVTMSMSGWDKRAYLHAQMTFREVTDTLTVVRRYANA